MSANARNSAVSTTNTNPVVIFGIDSRGKPKGARFANEYAGLAVKAASQLHLQVLGSNTPNVAEIAARLPVGRVHANGRTFVPFIRRDLYDKLLAAASNVNTALPPSSPANTPPSAGGAGSSAKPNLPKTWQAISIGDLVIAQESLEDGWYEAICMDVSGDMITLRWRDYPKERRIVRNRRRLGLLYPGTESSPQQGKAAKAASSAKPEKSAATKAESQTLPKDWRDIDVNTLVLARDEGPLPAWWEAIPIEKAGDNFKLRWRDHANIPPITRPRLQLALICPDPA